MLTKLAMQYKQAEENEKETSAIPSVAALGGGALLLNAAPSRILGYQDAYHGTSKANAEKVKQEGLRADLGGTGSTKTSGLEHNIKNSQGHVHATTYPAVAKMYANYADLNQEDMRRMALNPLKQLWSLNPNGEVIRLRMDYDKFKRSTPDPDSFTHHMFEAPDPNIFKTTENITPEEIAGSRSSLLERIRHRTSKLPAYIQSHPLRFGAGLGLAGSGAGLAYLGGKGLYDQVTE